jgi:uncharacterized phage protein gp47/JayE
MPDLLDASGLQTKTLPEIITDLEDGLKVIYGTDINVDQNSPDGQLINLFAQAARDLRELLTSINNGFDPDQALGKLLDQRVVLNNILRQGGTFTIQPIDITTDRTVSLDGLDADFNDPDGQGYTIQDDAGTEWILIDSVVLVAGTISKNFRARTIGLVETIVGTITNFLTIVLGVTAVNNSVGALQVGKNEETDTELRLRRQQSIAIASNGYLNGILAAVLNIVGVTDANIFENVTNSVDADTIPAHGIWLIVEGGANTDIADVLFDKKSAGADMKGVVTVDIITQSGAIFTAKFDRPDPEDLHIRFDIEKTDPSATFDQPAIKAQMVQDLTYSIGETAETSRVTAQAVQAINDNGGGGVPLNVEVSDDGAVWVDFLEVPAKDDQWVLDVARITITEL